MKHLYKKKLVKTIFVIFSLLIAVLLPETVKAQCDPSVPHFNVNLVSNPGGTWISPNVARNGLCCGTSLPDRCIHFTVLLDSSSQGIIFDIASGAIPPGAMYYQVGCAIPTAVGDVLCLNGPGPHEITFCKPGNNANTYSITSIPRPEVSAPIVIAENCAGSIYGSGYNDTTIQWNSVYPGAYGAWNSLLNCTTCDTITVTAPLINPPPYIDYEICGMPAGVCLTATVCDTVRVYIIQSLVVDIFPDTSYMCPGSKLTMLTATTTGGALPYSLSWSTGATSPIIYVDTGQYIVTVTDSTACPSATDTATVIWQNIVIEVNGGPDLTVCQDDLPVTLSGSFSGSLGATWIANGLITPHPDSMNITYYPTPAELAAGVAYLKLSSVGDFGCPPDSDIVEIRLPITPVLDAGHDVTICLGDTTQLNALGGYIYIWDNSTTLSDTSIANPLAYPTATTTYTVMTMDTSGQLISNGDFALGNSGFVSNYIYQFNLLPAGYYYVGGDPNDNNISWSYCSDYTGDGNMMIVNGASTTNVVIWQQTISVTPNTDYTFSTWITNVNPVNPALLQFSINGVLQSVPFTSTSPVGQWEQFYVTWNSGAAVTADVSIVNQNNTPNGNDFAIDGISFAPICQSTDSVTVFVDLPPIIDPGPDQAICEDALPVTLNGTYSNAISAVWIAPGIFIPNNSTMNATYQPTAGEIAMGHSTVYLSATGTLACGNVIDSMFIAIVHTPNLDAGNNDTICYGDSIQLNATGADSYIWSPISSISDPYISNPIAFPSVTTTYYVSGYNLSNQFLINGDFTSGNSGFSSSYNYQLNLNNPGYYCVGTSPYIHNGAFSKCGDHTTGTGNMLIINGNNNPNAIAWQQTVPVIPNTDYVFTYWVLNAQDGTIGNVQSGINGLPYGSVTMIDSTGCQWRQITESWNSGVNTTVDLSILTQPSTIPGNNIAIDDIYFGPLCMAMDSVQIMVTPQNVTAGPDGVVCEGVPFQITMANASNFVSVVWTTSGTGTFNNPNILNPAYTPSNADALTGGVTLTVTVLGFAPCLVPVQDSLFLLVNPKPITSLIYHF